MTAHRPPAFLATADGHIFEGEAAGALLDTPQPAQGEAVFNTAMSGYQEVLTDPSYAGQIICFTSTHIGNYGTNATDDESKMAHCGGVIVRDLTTSPSNWRSTAGFETWLRRQGLRGITGIDTRRLTRHLRAVGAIPCAFGIGSADDIADVAASAPSTDGRDLVAIVTTSEIYERPGGPHRLAVYDFGVKETMLRQLSELASLTVVPAKTSADDVLALEPDAIFLSNGPGDPAALPEETAIVADLLGKLPIFGICLGHQLLSAALGGKTYKLPFGHHGSNHPVGHLESGRVEITSQNHNYAVTDVPGATVTHRNLNDGVIEGIAHATARCVSVQYHPEAGPGPHDARPFFDDFARTLAVSRKAG